VLAEFKFTAEDGSGNQPAFLSELLPSQTSETAWVQAVGTFLVACAKTNWSLENQCWGTSLMWRQVFESLSVIAIRILLGHLNQYQAERRRREGCRETLEQPFST